VETKAIKPLNAIFNELEPIFKEVEEITDDGLHLSLTLDNLGSIFK